MLLLCIMPLGSISPKVCYQKKLEIPNLQNVPLSIYQVNDHWYPQSWPHCHHCHCIYQNTLTFLWCRLFSIDLELIQRQHVCSTKYLGILKREQYLSGKTKPNCQDSCEQIKMSCCTLCRWPLILLLGFLSLSFKNDSKKPATKIVAQGTAKLLNLIHIVQQSMK